jgi:transposase InsO family protein
MKWIESIPARTAMDKVIINFLEENIFSRFGCPRKIVIDNAHAFKSTTMNEFCERYNVTMENSTPYYPDGNGFA